MEPSTLDFMVSGIIWMASSAVVGAEDLPPWMEYNVVLLHTSPIKGCAKLVVWPLGVVLVQAKLVVWLWDEVFVKAK